MAVSVDGVPVSTLANPLVLPGRLTVNYTDAAFNVAAAVQFIPALTDGSGGSADSPAILRISGGTFSGRSPTAMYIDPTTQLTSAIGLGTGLRVGPTFAPNADYSASTQAIGLNVSPRFTTDGTHKILNAVGLAITYPFATDANTPGSISLYIGNAGTIPASDWAIYSNSALASKFIGDLQIGAHLIANQTGGPPATSNLGANVTSVTFTGNDTRGKIVIVMAGALAANTRIATCTWISTFGTVTPIPLLVSETSGAGLAIVNFYSGAESATTFDLFCEQALAAGTYTVRYWNVG